MKLITDLMRKLYCPIIDCKKCKVFFEAIGNKNGYSKRIIRKNAGSCDPWKDKDRIKKKKYQHNSGTINPLFGCTVHWGGTREEVFKQIDDAKELGCTSIRMTFSAEYFDQQLTNWISYVRRAMNSGITVVAILGMSAKNGLNIYPPMDSPEFMPAWKVFLDKFNRYFSTYKQSMIVQILNENNANYFYDTTAGQYMAILSYSYDRLKAFGWPTVIMCGLVNPYEKKSCIGYLEQMIYHGLANKTDGLCFHWYLGDDDEYTWLMIDAISFAYGKDCGKPVYITEFGHPKSSHQIQTFDKFYKVFGKEWSIYYMFWYVMKGHGEFALLDDNYNRKPIYNHIKGNL